MPIVLQTVDAANIPIRDLTEVSLTGDGIFDKFLRLHRAVLDREFTDGRIVGKEYSDTFTKTYTANLELAISFLVAKEKQAYDIQLQEAQIAKAQADTNISLKQLEILTARLPLELRELEASIAKTNADILISTKQLEILTAKLPHEINLLEATVDKMEADVLIANKQLDILAKDLELKIAKLPHEIRFMVATANKMEADVLNSIKQLELLEQQLLLQVQKVITEKAQTQAGIAEEGSIIDTNIKALLAQIEGMDRDAKQKVASLLVSTWNTRMNNDEALPNIENYLTDPAIGQSIQDVLNSVQMTVLPEINR